MDSSKRAVESYWRSRMIDAATSDEEKVTPVYKLEEICELLRSSHPNTVKELSEFILKRIQHKSPIVKQKALRLIKYAVGQSGVGFRREMQRHSSIVRQLFHYKGQVDPLKGDALNKAVRDTAHEVVSAIFSEDSKPAASEQLNKRIEGFGNTFSEMPSEDQKSFLSEVVGFGSASIMQGLSNLAQGHALRKSDNGSNMCPILRRSLTSEKDHSDRYEAVKLHNETVGSFGISKSGGHWNEDILVTKKADATLRRTREEHLLETIVTSGGVRLQPTRDAIQVFLLEAVKLDMLALSHALESKLNFPLWQVRLKTACVLESILWRKDDGPFSVVASYFSENRDSVLKCSDFPQTSLKEKANKILRILDGEQEGILVGNLKKKEKEEKAETAPSVQVPMLLINIDGSNDFSDKPSSQAAASATPLIPSIDALLGGTFTTHVSRTEPEDDEKDDTFAGISFHTSESCGEHVDLFSGMAIADEPSAKVNQATKNVDDLFDMFGPQEPKLDLNHETNTKKDPTSDIFVAEKVSNSSFDGHNGSNAALNAVLGSEIVGIEAKSEIPAAALPYSLPPTGSFLGHQQFFGSCFRQNVGGSHGGGANVGGSSSPLPDIFHPNYPNHLANSSSKKEDTKAFDFISDHFPTTKDSNSRR